MPHLSKYISNQHSSAKHFGLRLALEEMARLSLTGRCRLLPSYVNDVMRDTITRDTDTG